MLAEIFLVEIEFLNDLLKSRPTKNFLSHRSEALVCVAANWRRVLMTLRGAYQNHGSPTYNAPAERARLRRRQPNTGNRRMIKTTAAARWSCNLQPSVHADNHSKLTFLNFPESPNLLFEHDRTEFPIEPMEPNC